MCTLNCQKHDNVFNPALANAIAQTVPQTVAKTLPWPVILYKPLGRNE